MPLKLNVGASKKVGEANYGSRGASVYLELELDPTLIGEPQKLQERIRQLFSLVRVSLAEELKGGHGTAPADNHAGADTPPRPSAVSNGSAAPLAEKRTGGWRPATQYQINAIYAIAHRQQLDLSPLLEKHFQVQRPEDLSLKQASQVIEDLRSPPDSAGG